MTDIHSLNLWKRYGIMEKGGTRYADNERAGRAQTGDL